MWKFLLNKKSVEKSNQGHIDIIDLTLPEEDVKEDYSFLNLPLDNKQDIVKLTNDSITNTVANSRQLENTTVAIFHYNQYINMKFLD